MPKILIAATPAHGHVAPLKAIASRLTASGFDVTFLTASAFEPSLRSTGARFLPLAGAADVDLGDPASFPQRAALPGGPAQLDFDIRHMFGDPVPSQHLAIQAFLERQRALDPHMPVVVIHDTVFMGVWPVLLGAPGLRPAGVIGIGVTPLPLRSIDTAPFGLGIPPDTSDAGRERNQGLNQMVATELFGGTQTYLNEVLRAAGAREEAPFVVDGMVSLPDRFLQLGVAAIEYDRSDAPAGLRYIGALPAPAGERDLPPWWSDVLGDKPVVVVTQGTMANRDLGALVHPTLEALADRDVIVVVATGRTPSEVGAVPANARVAEYVPFASLLPHAAVMVSNGGYGGAQQALACGVPLVLAGDTEDKIEVNARIAHSGAAINLRTGQPTAQQLREAVDQVLSTPTFRHRAQQLKRDYAAHDPFGAIEATIRELASSAVPSAKPHPARQPSEA